MKTYLPRKVHFTSSEKVIELVERGGGITDQESRLMLDQAIATGRGGITDQESRLMLDQAIATGRGGIFLSLTEEQYLKMKR